MKLGMSDVLTDTIKYGMGISANMSNVQPACPISGVNQNAFITQVYSNKQGSHYRRERILSPGQ